MNTSSKFVVACHILTVLAAHRQLFELEGVSSTTLAESVNTNPVVIRRLLAHLKQAGWVDSRSGPGGGYFLCCEARDIGLDQVHREVEQGSLYHMHHCSPNEQCPMGAELPAILAKLLGQAESAFLEELEKFCVEDLLAQVIRQSDLLRGKSIQELRALWVQELKQ